MILNKRYSCIVMLILISACNSGQNHLYPENDKLVMDHKADIKIEQDNQYIFNQSSDKNKLTPIKFMDNLPVSQLRGKLMPILAPMDD